MSPPKTKAAGESRPKKKALRSFRPGIRALINSKYDIFTTPSRVSDKAMHTLNELAAVIVRKYALCINQLPCEERTVTSRMVDAASRLLLSGETLFHVLRDSTLHIVTYNEKKRPHKKTNKNKK